MNRSVRIYTVFTSAGLFGSTQTYPVHHPEGKVLSNQEILSEIQRRCDAVEFLGGVNVEKPAYALANIRARRHSIDGVLYFGPLPAELAGLDLPIVAVYPLWGQWQAPFNPYPQSRAPAFVHNINLPNRPCDASLSSLSRFKVESVPRNQQRGLPAGNEGPPEDGA